MSGTLKDFFVAAPHDTGDAVTGHYYEIASADPNRAQVWGYTDALSYQAGDTLTLHAISHCATFEMSIWLDGATPRQMTAVRVSGGFAETPPDCSVKGCDWPARWSMDIPADWPSGVYRIALAVEGHQSEHMFVVRPNQKSAPSDIVMILCTGTWCAYNDWGGSNHYQGLTGPKGDEFSPHVSILRPWAIGFVQWPSDAPRIPYASPLNSPPRYPHMDYARANGVSKKYASSGWAAFERPFALWCAEQGISVDFITQHDLHVGNADLSRYRRAVIVGHDEYWTWEMRDHLEQWIDAGGELARFGGNFFWQTRLSEDRKTQICYKSRAMAEDPTPDPSRLTSYWDDPRIGRPATATMGLTGAAGVYAGWSRCAAHGSGGFTLYRPEHWALRGTGLGYGDVLGKDATVFGYEVDGIDYTMAHGLPFAADDTGLAGDLTIVAMAPATTLAHATGDHDADPFIGSDDLVDLADKLHGSRDPELLARLARGNGMMAEYRRGKGAVLNAGSCEWVAGLIKRDAPVERVTRNILCGDWR